jgi:hypothetical protein
MSRQESKVRLVAQSIPTLSEPAAYLDPNRQALYWAYALYDNDKLTSEFGVPPRTIVDFGMARAKLLELMPKLDAKTRVAIGRYLPKPKRKP